MARDYKHRAHRKTNKKQTSGWVWLLAGYLLGVFTVALVWLKLPELDSASSWVGAGPEQSVNNEQPDPDKQQKKRVTPHFDFYTLLPEMEVVVPETELEGVTGRVEPTATIPESQYLLQVGSFRKSSDAERLKAQLALLGFEADIQRVSINNKDTFHRVRVGPFADKIIMQGARQRLERNGHDSIVIRLRG